MNVNANIDIDTALLTQRIFSNLLSPTQHISSHLLCPTQFIYTLSYLVPSTSPLISYLLLNPPPLISSLLLLTQHEQYVTDVDAEVSKKAISSIGCIARRVAAVAPEMTQQ